MADSRTAVLVVVGLLVGVVAGYGIGFVLTQPQITQLQSDLSDTETALSASQSEVESLQGQLTDAETQITNLTSDLAGARATIAEYETQISNLESDLSDAQETISNYEDQITSLGSEISYLQSLLVPEQGYEKFAAYGFSFEHPKQMQLMVFGVLEAAASMHSGFIMAVRQDASQLLLVGWSDQEYPKDLNLGLEEAFEGFGAYSFAKGQKVSSTMDGHEMLYQNFTVTLEGRFYNGVVGAWNCDINEMLFFIFYIDLGEDALTPFMHYLDSFICH